MPGGCVVPMCNGRGGFVFPQKDAMFNQWLVAIKRNDTKAFGKMWKPKNRLAARVCVRHFTPDDFRRTTTGKLKLKNGTVPSVFEFKKDGAVSTSSRELRYRLREEKNDPVRTSTVISPLLKPCYLIYKTHFE